MLSSPETNIAYGNERAWEYINTHLMGENDKKACLHVLKGEARKLARLGTNGIRIGSEGSKDFVPYFATCGNRYLVMVVVSKRAALRQKQ